MKNQAFTQKLRFAWQGICYATRTESNMRRHWFIAIAALLLFGWLQPALIWWALVVLCIGLVLAAELVNAALEALMDHLHPELHPQIGHAKDILAGMVLILSVTAAIIGLFALLSVQGIR